MRFTATLFALTVAGLSHLNSVTALYSSRDAVISLDPKTWKAEVTDTEHVVLAEFFAPWCGHCKNLAPEYKKAAEKLKGLVKVVAFDCDAHKEFCGQFGVQGFPTIKLFQSNKKLAPLDYQGARTAKAMVDYAVARIPAAYVAKVDSSNVTLDAFQAAKPDLAKVLLVSSKPTIPPLFRALSIEFNGRLAFGVVKDKDTDTVSALGVETAPAVVVVPAGTSQPIAYSGSLKHEPLVKFLETHAAPKVTKEKKKEEKKKEEKKEEPFDPSIAEVKTQLDLETKCTQKPGVCVISFLSLEPDFPESVSAHLETMSVLESVKTAFKTSSFHFVWLNAVETGRQLVKDFDVSDMLPALLVVNEKRKMYRPFRGAFEEAAVKSFLMDVAGGRGRSFQYTFTPVLEKVKEKVVVEEEKVEKKVEEKVEEKIKDEL